MSHCSSGGRRDMSSTPKRPSRYWAFLAVISQQSKEGVGMCVILGSHDYSAIWSICGFVTSMTTSAALKLLLRQTLLPVFPFDCWREHSRSWIQTRSSGAKMCDFWKLVGAKMSHFKFFRVVSGTKKSRGPCECLHLDGLKNSFNVPLYVLVCTCFEHKE